MKNNDYKKKNDDELTKQEDYTQQYDLGQTGLEQEAFYPPESDYMPEQMQENFIKNEKDSGSMKKANELASKLLRRRLEKERPDDAKVMNEIKEDDIIVIKGQYDRIEDILSISKIPHKLLSASQLKNIKLNPNQMLIINCPGYIERESIIQITKFVEDGGYLFTTDWALLNVLEKSFPGYVKYNQKPTIDDTVQIEIIDKDNPFLDMIMSDSADPNWWLEGSSYPIQVLNKSEVKILIQSREMKEKYDEEAIAIFFKFGKGKVFHITSHFYLQRADMRTERHKASSKEYFANEMAFSESEYSEFEEDMEDVQLGEAQSAYSMQQFINNIIIDKKKSQKKKKTE